MADTELITQFQSLKRQIERLKLEQARLEESEKFHMIRVAEIFRKNGVSNLDELKQKNEEAARSLQAALARWKELLDQVEERIKQGT